MSIRHFGGTYYERECTLWGLISWRREQRRLVSTQPFVYAFNPFGLETQTRQHVETFFFVAYRTVQNAILLKLRIAAHFIANQFALASDRKQAEGCGVSSAGFVLHESEDCLFCLTLVCTDLQYKSCTWSTMYSFLWFYTWPSSLNARADLPTSCCAGTGGKPAVCGERL